MGEEGVEVRGDIPDFLWAKTTKSGNMGKSVLSHLNDVREVAYLLLQNSPMVLSKTGLCAKQIATFSGLHDIGKVSPGFQAKCVEWLEKYRLPPNYGIGYETNHSVVTQFTIKEILQKTGVKTEAAELWATILGAHHSKLHRPGLILRVSDGEWQSLREEIVNEFLNGEKLPDFTIDCLWPFLWWVTGLVTVSDWIGSAEDWFPVMQETLPADSKRNARVAIQEIGFGFPHIRKGLSFSDIFIDTETSIPFVPNDLQIKAEQNIKEPGLYIIEAPMGMGKTEAALWCTYQLMQQGKAYGFYFALPTQATSNRIYTRINEFLERVIEGGESSARLIHSGSWLLDETKVPEIKTPNISEQETKKTAIDWFASKKRGLLAPFGVGTIDQALMSIIAVKHFFVRQYGLAGKVVILDEVHSYDLYTGTLIKALCDQLLPLNSTIILLSATLTKEAKGRFIKIDTEEDYYPQISGKFIRPVEITKPKQKLIKVQMRDEVDALKKVLEKAMDGCSVLWVSDTVDKSQKMFELAQKSKQSNIELGLLHSRFPVFRRRELEDYWMEKLGKSSKSRSGCILFSTQIVEQSVDLDADFMVSELAPTDMLLQRMGRLWRHRRPGREGIPEFCIVSEKFTFETFWSASASKIKQMFGTKAMVYSPYVLLRSLQLWKDIKEIRLPDDIRDLLKCTYEESKKKEPDSWKELLSEVEGQAEALRFFALNESNVWQLLADDEEGKAKTRINNFETIQLILASGKEEKKRELLNGESIHINSEGEFLLSVAKSLHKNIVRVPSYCFSGSPDSSVNKTISTHIRGAWQIGYINKGNTIECRYLKKNYKLMYTPEKGVEIMKTGKRNEVDYEPCD